MSEIVYIKQGKLVGVQTSLFTIFNAEKYDASVIPTAWQEFFQKAAHTELASGQTFYGASIPSMSFDVPMDYFAGALVDSDFVVPEGFASVEIPGGNHFCVEHAGPIANIAASYEKTYMEELPASGKEMRLAPHLEIYDALKDPNSADYTMLIGVPVQ